MKVEHSVLPGHLGALLVGLATLSVVGAGWHFFGHSVAESSRLRALPPHEMSAPAAVEAREPVRAPAADLCQAGDCAEAAEGKARQAPHSKILVLGDSILFGGFGVALEEKLRIRGDEVWVYGSCGASSVSFLRGIRSECGSVHYEPGRKPERVTGPSATPKVEQLLTSVKPDAALLVLGTNFLCCAAEAAPDVKALALRLAEAKVPCLWVGIPSFKQPVSGLVSKHYAMLEQSIGDSCTLLDARSLGIHFRDVGDHVHVEPVSGQQWAEAVVGATTRMSLHGGPRGSTL